MQRFKRRAALLLSFLALLAAALVVPAPAQAASDYDSLLRVAPSLYVYTDGTAQSQTMDISSTWWQDFKDSYALRVAQYIPNYPTDFATKFEEIMASGGSWGVTMDTAPYGKIISLYGTDDPNASCSFGGDLSTGYFACRANVGYTVVKEQYFTHSSYGNNGCSAGCSSNGMNVYGAPSVIAPSQWANWVAVLSNTDLVNTQFFVWNFNVEYPVGYEGATLPHTRVTNTGASYVALGDSFSSGEANSPYEATTDTTGVDQCHRSLDYAYPQLLARDSSLTLGDMAFVACSGATTDTLLNGGSGKGVWGEGSQLNALSSSTQVITLTIGGNDMGFKSVMDSCIRKLGTLGGWGCKNDPFLPNALTDRLSALSGTASTTQYEPEDNREIHSIGEILSEVAAAAPSARVLIAGYPHLFGSNIATFDANQAAPGGASCSVGVGTNISYEDAQWLNGWTDSLDAVIGNAVAQAKLNGIDVAYVDPIGFTGHGFCDTGDSYFMWAFLDENKHPDPSSLHPDNNGAIYGYQIPFTMALLS